MTKRKTAQVISNDSGQTAQTGESSLSTYEMTLNQGIFSVLYLYIKEMMHKVQLTEFCFDTFGMVLQLKQIRH